VDTTEDDLRRVESLDREATPGPWYVNELYKHKEDQTGSKNSSGETCFSHTRYVESEHKKGAVCSTGIHTRDVELIAEYRTLAPRLAASLRAARSRIAEVEGERDDLRKHWQELRKEVGLTSEGFWICDMCDEEKPRPVAESERLRSERDTARAELAEMTRDRDEWRSAASDGLSVIRSLKTDALAADGRTGEVPGDVREAAEEFMDYENDSSVSPTPVWAPGEIVARFVLSLKTAPPAAPDPTATNGG
jgi:hypothetical protein